MDLAFKSLSPDAILNLRHQVLRIGKPLSTAHFDGDHDDFTFHLGCIFNGEVVGCVSLMAKQHPDFEEIKSYQLRGMAVDEKCRGMNIGRQLLKFAESKMQSEQVKLIWCNVRTSAEMFYTKNNYQRLGNVFDIPNIGPHVLMYKNI